MNKKRPPVKTIILLVIISVISILYVRIKVEHVKIGYEISTKQQTGEVPDHRKGRT